MNRIFGLNNEVVFSDPIASSVGEGLFVFENITSPAVKLEGFSTMGKGGGRQFYIVDNRTDKPLVFAHMAMNGGKPRKPGRPGSKFFLEDVAGRITLEVGKGEQAWLRQFNPEMPLLPMSVVDGGMMWILGMKTEGRATHVVAKNGAKVELIGGTSYQSWSGQEIDPPMFVVQDSDVSVTIPIHGRKQPFTTIVEETFRGQTKTLGRKEHNLNHHLPLYRSGGR